MPGDILSPAAETLTTSRGSSLVSDTLLKCGHPADNDHLVHFYESDGFLLDSLSQFISSGLSMAKLPWSSPLLNILRSYKPNLPSRISTFYSLRFWVDISVLTPKRSWPISPLMVRCRQRALKNHLATCLRR